MFKMKLHVHARGINTFTTCGGAKSRLTRLFQLVARIEAQKFEIFPIKKVQAYPLWYVSSFLEGKIKKFFAEFRNPTGKVGLNHGHARGFQHRGIRFFISTILIAGIAFFGWEFAHSAYPKKIISLAPSITKNLYLLGAEDKIIAVTVYCPPESQKKEKIGTILEPNIEKILSLGPDLVIATKEGNQPATIEKLKKLGLNVFIMESCNNFSDICEGFFALGQIVGMETKAAEIIEISKKRIENLRKKTARQRPVRIFWEVGAQPLFTISSNSFVNDFIELAGGENIFSGLKARYPQISKEEVLRRDPEIIIITTMGDATEKEKEVWKQFKELSAAKNGRIYAVKESYFTDPTPVGIANGAERIAAIIQENFKQ